MTPIDLILWALAAGVSVLIIGIAGAIVYHAFKNGQEKKE